MNQYQSLKLQKKGAELLATFDEAWKETIKNTIFNLFAQNLGKKEI